MKTRRATGATPNSRRRRLRIESLEQRMFLSSDAMICYAIYIESTNPDVEDPYAPFCHAVGALQQLAPTESQTESNPTPDQRPAGLKQEANSQEKTVSISLELADAEGRHIDQVHVGEVVQLKVIAHDLRATPRGVFAVYADIEYPAGLVPLGEETFDPYFANGRSGFNDQRGLIDELGGFGGIEYPADPTRTLVATIPMRAVAVGAQPIALNAADYADNLVLLHGWDDAVPVAQIDYLGTTVTVVERESDADTITSAGSSEIPPAPVDAPTSLANIANDEAERQAASLPPSALPRESLHAPTTFEALTGATRGAPRYLSPTTVGSAIDELAFLWTGQELPATPRKPTGARTAAKP